MVRATQTVASSMKVLATSLENAPRPHSEIKAKVLAKPIKINAVVALEGGPQPGGVVHPPNPRG